MSEWYLAADRYSSRCHFDRANPEPPPPPREPCDHCGCCCDDDEDYYAAVLHCHEGPNYLVQLADGTYVQACSPDAHGHEVLWFGERYRFPQRESIFTLMMREVYPDTRIEESVEKRSALWASLESMKPFTYRVISLDA